MDYFDLGEYGRKITTTSPDAQTWFDRGLNWTFGYNHGEAVSCFKKAIEADPSCAMAYWGLAYANGPFYNMPWDFFSPREAAATVPLCHGAIETAHAKSVGVSPIERALIGPLPPPTC